VRLRLGLVDIGEPGDTLGTCVNGLMVAAFTLSHDRDADDLVVWRELLRACGLPKDLDLATIEQYAEANDAQARSVHGGCRENVLAYLKHLERTQPATYKALAQAKLGHWNGS
jgi:hypothetical protein